MINFVEIPDIDPTYVERVVQAYNHLETVKKRLDSVQAKIGDFNSRRAVAAEKIKVGKETAEEAQKALRKLILNQREASESAVKSARSEFNKSLSVLKEFHRELERLDNAERTARQSLSLIISALLSLQLSEIIREQSIHFT